MFNLLISNLRFELRTRYRSLSTYMYFILFFALSLLTGLAAGGAFKGATVSLGFGNKVFYNSQMSLSMIYALASAFLLFIITPTFGQAVIKDYLNKIDQIIYSKPISPQQFLLSRFISSLLFMLFISLSLSLGLWVSTWIPSVLESTITTNRWGNYISPYFTVLIPNIFIFGGLSYFVASRTKKMGTVYVMGILIFMGWMLSGSLLQEVENKLIGTLLDPFGISAIGETVKYWSADQQNTKSVVLESYFLYNRLLWCSLAGLALLWSLITFKTDTAMDADKKSSKKKTPQVEPAALSNFKMPRMESMSFSSVLWRQVRMEYQHVLKSIYFRTLLLAGIGFMLVSGQQVGKMLGTNTFPVTYAVLDLMGGSFQLFILIIITFFAGEVVWRDRDAKLQQVIDSYPAPTASFLLAKVLNLILVVATLLFAIIVCGLVIQISRGYTNFEFSLYFKSLYGLSLIHFLNIAILAVFLQVILNNKYLAHGAMILYYICISWASSLGLEHKLYLFNSSTQRQYSDMNGFGHFLPGYFLLKFYWLSLSLVLLCLALIFWQRGTLTAWKDRSREAARRWTMPVKVLTALGLSSFIALGGFLFYNTNILNTYTTTQDSEAFSVAYETKYSKHKNAPQPHIVGVRAFVDIFPKINAANIKYVFTLKNKTSQNLTEIFLNVPSKTEKHIAYAIEFNQDTQLDLDDKESGVRIYKFVKPLRSGDTLEMVYTAIVTRPGIPNSKDSTNIIDNGTFFNSDDYTTTIGYADGIEISSTKTRSKYNLPPKLRMPRIDDKVEHQKTYISNYSTWIDFEATVSTDSDQIAIAPGYLQKEWKKNGRKYFHYKMDHKILNFYAFLSGRYTVKKDKWNDVNIEVYYHKDHGYNVDKMIEATKLSLDYFTTQFGPYQHKQYRIIEFPRYKTFAQAFPNTIPFSEAVGFIAHVKPEDPKDVDYPFYVTSHELAHQWWAHQLIGANVQGATMLSESLSQYSALMVLEKKYGKPKMKRFLRLELERYLFGRAQENEYEQPLYLNENQQYIHYEKGSLVFYALKEYLGEDVLNSAIKSFLDKNKFQEPPFALAPDFVSHLKQRTPTQTHPLIEDLLEKIVLFDLKPTSAVAKKLPDGQYEVTLKIAASKWYSDKNGKEETATFEQMFDIGITDEKGDFIYLKPHLVKNNETTILVKVAQLPVKAGVDPIHFIIDRTPDDNLIPVSLVNTESSPSP